MDISSFLDLAKVFNQNGYRLYLVGGSARDYLLKRPLRDLDLASNATPNEMKQFLKNANYHYARFGSVRLHNIDITTLRKEEDYHDYRHPRIIKFTQSIEEDYVRRDFTINALYIDEKLKVYDFANGLDDLHNKIIRFIGNPDKRVKEDPLRILRAERFARKLGFMIEPASLKAMNDNKCLLEKLNDNKIKEEIKKQKT